MNESFHQMFTDGFNLADFGILAMAAIVKGWLQDIDSRALSAYTTVVYSVSMRIPDEAKVCN